ncbi:sensor histidine kinase [Eubacterium oxidoreducens]|uniref:histidine kinase n=1 Tax=Eubacterium oxidoreducens TaxID=1732 RepID=A0A1G6AR03_EUBOX|nr:HAMP domain-containing sensor histidine kinase [Eubacterium oxidoreducens]SDB10820.1 Signal transduction histidine kinase [Eubacterium oxidoreducens]
MIRKKQYGSIRTKMLIIIIAVVVGTLVLCLCLNSLFLSTFYSIKKQNLLMESYEKINTACEKGTLYNNSFQTTFETIASNGNISISVLTSDWDVVLTSASNYSTIRSQIGQLLFDSTVESDVIIENENYRMVVIQDERLQEQYIVLFGTLEDGNQILMRTPLEGIKESVLISNQFLLIVGAISIAAGAFAVLLITKKITDPILYLTELSKKMTQLDFEAKYVSRQRRKNEVDVLGEHMNDMSNQLEQTIAELKSANVELQKDIDKKNEIDKMRKEFLSNVSHELKTPIALVQGYAEGLKESVEDEENRDFYCDVIIDEAAKMNELVKKLLTLNQLEFGQNQVEMKRFELMELVGGVVQNSNILAKQENISIEFEKQDPIYVWGDEFKIEEVITNYMSNAIHYASGEKKIRVWVTGGTEKVRVNVFNTGSCIPPEDIDRIWGKFYKVDKARTREYGGNGIGLSIVKAIMDSHGQKCGVENLQNGVNFWFEMDCSKEQQNVVSL